MTGLKMWTLVVVAWVVLVLSSGEHVHRHRNHHLRVARLYQDSILDQSSGGGNGPQEKTKRSPLPQNHHEEEPTEAHINQPQADITAWNVVRENCTNCTSSSGDKGENDTHHDGKITCPIGCVPLKDEEHDEHHEGIRVASWRWFYVRTPFIYTFFVILAGLCKVGFHHADVLSSLLPESCLLVLLGTIVGGIVYVSGSDDDIIPKFEPKTFFLFLLPPIMLESAYSLHDRAFAENIGTVLLYAVVGTIINCFTIGPTLYGLAVAGAMGELNLGGVEALVFSALISAVDPVAVLAIFQEVGVNKDLYFLVFGESLLNDAVTVVIYTMMVAFTTMKTITADQVGLGIAAFFCVSVGGLCIGIIFGILTALITKLTEEVRVVEPLALLGMAYMSYLMAEMVHFSGIISIIGCGLVQAQYAVANISSKSYTTVKYFSKMLSATCDCIIFFFLGLVLINDQHIWQTGFVLWSVALCLVYRFGCVFFLTYLVNHSEKIRYIDYEEQFIMAYGGLRGAVCFSLVIMLDEKIIPNKQLFVTTTLVVILFTVFIQGGTIKPLVKWLEIQSHKEEHLSLTSEINGTLIDHVMAGIEEIAGERGENYLKLLIYRYDEKYLKKWLQRTTTDGSNLCKVYEKIAIQDHYAHLYGATSTDDEKKIILQNSFDPDQDELHVRIKPPAPMPIEPIPKKQPSKKKDANASGKGPSCPFSPSIFDNAVKPKGKVSMIAQTLVGVGQTVASPLLMDSMQAAVTLRKALRDNYYNKFHQKYNPNLIRDDEQELGEQLRLRRLRARRLTMAALSPTTSNQSSRTDLSQIAEESSDAIGRMGHGDRIRSQSLANASDLLAERVKRRKLNLGKAQTMDDATLSQGAADAAGAPLHRQLVALRSNGSVSSVDSERSSGSRNSMGDMELKSAPLDTITESENDNDHNGDHEEEQQPFLGEEDSVFESPNSRRRHRQLAKEHKVDVEEEPETIV